MKNIPKQIYQHRYFLLFIWLFAYCQSIFIRINIRQEINFYTFTPDAAFSQWVGAGILFLLIISFIKRYPKNHLLSTTKLIAIGFKSVVLFVGFMLLIGLAIAAIFDNIERNFNPQTLSLTILSSGLNALIYGSFFLAYYYFQTNKNHQKKLETYQKALTESQIHQLKSQLNPHFLFNNLNILDQLIIEDKHKASDFLNEFANIYRYVLQASEKQCVPIQEEIQFAQEYFNLIHHKYGNAYQLQIEASHNNGYIAPLTLQLLIENAVQHNLGTPDHPIYIKITVNQWIAVANNKQAKRTSKATAGRALNNLKAQYQHLTTEPIIISNNEETFTVTLPIIHTTIA